MRVLVTGGTGLVGSHILRKLVYEDDIEVVATKRETSKTDLIDDILDRIEWHECDVMDLVQLTQITKDIDVVIHAAALISFKPKDQKRIFDINVGGTAHIVDCCLANNVNKLIHVSSVSAFGGSRNKPITEEDVWVDKPLKSNYGHSKYLAEQEVWRGKAEGLNVNIVSPSIVIGAGYWDTEPAFIKNIAAGFSYYPMGANGIVDARDIADMVAMVMRADQGGEKFICSAGNTSFKELVKQIAELSDLSLSFKPLSGWLYQLVLFFTYMGSLLGVNTKMTVESLQMAQEEILFDNTKSREKLNFRYRSIDQTLKDTIRLYNESMTKGKDFGIPSRF